MALCIVLKKMLWIMKIKLAMESVDELTLVNSMLDEVSVLLESVSGVGDVG